MKKLLIILTLLVALQVKADEGMWAIHSFNHALQNSSVCFYSESSPSLKDAVVAVGEGGSGSFISKTGLVLTNMHVIKSFVAKAGSEDNILSSGFCSGAANPELKLNELYLKILVRTIDVSAEVKQGLSKGQSWNHIIKSICLKYKPIDDGNQQDIKREYFGINHFLHEYKIINDVRLVYCPPQAMAFYGGDSVNWHWPRTSADFAILRAYTKGNDGNPTPFFPKSYLRVDKKGVKAGERLYVLGYPRGASNDRIAADSQESYLFSMMRRAEVLGLRMGIIDRAIQDQTCKNIDTWQLEASSLNNERLKTLGRVASFMRYMLPEKLKIREDSCALLLYKSNILKYKEFCYLRNSADSLARLINPLINSDDDYRSCIQAMKLINSAGLVRNRARFKESMLKQLVDRVFPISDMKIEKSVTKRLFNYLYNKNSIFIPSEIRKSKISVNDYVDSLFKCSSLVEKDSILSILLNKRAIQNDPALRYLEYTDSIYNSTIRARIVAYANQLNIVREKILIILHDYGFIKWSPTNGTLRVSSGTTGNQCWYTKLNREICQEWSNYGYKLRNSKSNGPATILNFTTDCHTSSGNSGSPVINECGKLVGLNFDRNIDGLCGDYYYLPSVCLNINLSMVYIIKILKSKKDSKLIFKEICI